MAARQRLQLTWYNKDKALIPTEHGKYGYTWVNPSDPRYCETRPIVFSGYVRGEQAPKEANLAYSERADLEATTDNLLIHGESGDVLEALTKVPQLSERYLGQVKLIYIDPPFNTSNAFIHYEDNLEHSIWLTMMRDRLLHMKRLLREDGSIWVHLDYEENHRMRLLLDEIFGPENFQAEVVWQKSDSPRRGDGFSIDQDTILVYRRSSGFNPTKSIRTAADNARFRNPDEDPRGPWWDGDPSGNHGDGSGGMSYAIENPLTGELMRPPRGRSWVFAQDRMFRGLSEWAPYRLENLHDAEWRAANEGVPLSKASDDVCALVLDIPLEESRRRIAERRKQPNWPEILIRSTGGLGRKAYIPSEGSNPRTWWTNDEVGHNRAAKSEIKALFRGEIAFDTPKPERLLERIIHIGSKPGDVVLDVFAGSGTTAAVAHKMGRRWVACELLENIFNRFTKARLEKVVRNLDAGGVTRTLGERVAVEDIDLPEGVSPSDAQRFTSLLNKVIADDPNLKNSAQVKRLKEMTKTRRTPDVANWRGGGGFHVAHLAPACFDYDPTLGRVMLTEAATGRTLIESVAANLRFELKVNDPYFDGSRGRTLLKVYEGVLTTGLVDEWLSYLAEDQKLIVATTGILDGVREHLRRKGKGSRVVHIPDDLFRYSEDADL